MSVEILSWKKGDNCERFELDIFKEFLISSHHDTLKNVDDKFVAKMFNLINVKEMIVSILKEYYHTSISVYVSSGLRTPKIHKAIYKAINESELKRGELKLTRMPADTQHFWLEAFDLHFYIGGKRIKGKELIAIFDIIDKYLGFLFQQLLLYPAWGIHFGLATSRKQYRFSRRR